MIVQGEDCTRSQGVLHSERRMLQRSTYESKTAVFVSDARQSEKLTFLVRFWHTWTPESYQARFFVYFRRAWLNAYQNDELSLEWLMLKMDKNIIKDLSMQQEITMDKLEKQTFLFFLIKFLIRRLETFIEGKAKRRGRGSPRFAMLNRMQIRRRQQIWLTDLSRFVCIACSKRGIDLTWNRRRHVWSFAHASGAEASSKIRGHTESIL